MDDHRNHSVLHPVRIGPVLIGAPVVPADHGVFHTLVLCVDRNRLVVGVIKGVGRIRLKRTGHGLGGELLPKRVPFLGIEGDRHDVFPADLHRHHVPDELARSGKAVIPDVLRPEFPGFGLLGKPFFSGLGFFLGDDQHRGIIGLLCFFVPGHHLFGEHFLPVEQDPGGIQYMVCGYGDIHIVISEGQGKFTTSPELVVLPPFYIAVDGHPGKKLGDDIRPVPVLWEILIPGTGTVHGMVRDVVPPFDRKRNLLPAAKCLRDIHAHHGLVDGVVQGPALCVLYKFDVKAPVKGFCEVLLGKGGRAVGQGNPSPIPEG